MKLICVSCGGFTYFEVELETLKAIEAHDSGLIMDDAIIDDWNYSDATLRDNLDDIINYVLNEPNETIGCDNENKFMICAQCGSRHVVVPCVKWNPPLDHISIDDELNQNRKEYNNLRKERHRENYLPLLWQP